MGRTFRSDHVGNAIVGPTTSLPRGRHLTRQIGPQRPPSNATHLSRRTHSVQLTSAASHLAADAAHRYPTATPPPSVAIGRAPLYRSIQSIHTGGRVQRLSVDNLYLPPGSPLWYGSIARCVRFLPHLVPPVAAVDTPCPEYIDCLSNAFARIGPVAIGLRPGNRPAPCAPSSAGAWGASFHVCDPETGSVVLRTPRFIRGGRLASNISPIRSATDRSFMVDCRQVAARKSWHHDDTPYNSATQLCTR